MNCPYCHAKRQNGRRCKKCGKRLPEEGEMVDLPQKKDRIWPKVLAMVLLVGALSFALFQLTRFMPQWQVAQETSSLPATVHKESTPIYGEGPLSDKPLMAIDPNDSVDALTGRWRIAGSDGIIEKIGYRKYRLREGDNFYFIRWIDDHYHMEKDAVDHTFYIDGKNTLLNTGGGKLGYRLDANGQRIKPPINPDNLIGDWVGTSAQPADNGSATIAAAHIVKLGEDRYRLYTVYGYRTGEAARAEAPAFERHKAAGLHYSPLNLMTTAAQVTDLRFNPDEGVFFITGATSYRSGQSKGNQYLNLHHSGNLGASDYPLPLLVSGRLSYSDGSYSINGEKVDLIAHTGASSDSRQVVKYWFYDNKLPN